MVKRNIRVKNQIKETWSFAEVLWGWGNLKDLWLKGSFGNRNSEEWDGDENGKWRDGSKAEIVDLDEFISQEDSERQGEADYQQKKRLWCTDTAK
jgi:hypothetical protein